MIPSWASEVLNLHGTCPCIALSYGVSIPKYVSDTQLYVTFDVDHQDEAVPVMEADISDIQAKITPNKLKLNEDKTQMFNIIPARQAQKVTISSMWVGDPVVTPHLLPKTCV